MAGSEKGSLELIISELVKLLEPLADSAADGSEGIIAFFNGLGDLRAVLTGASIDDLQGMADALKRGYDDLRPVLDSGDVDLSRLPDYVFAIKSVMQVTEGIGALEVNAGLEDMFADIGKRIFDYLLMQYLLKYHKNIYNTFLLSGIFQEKGRLAKLFNKTDFSYLPKLLGDPSITLRELYKWGGEDFDSETLFINLQRFLIGIGITAMLHREDTGESVPQDGLAAIPPSQLRLPIITLERDGLRSVIGLALTTLYAHNSTLSGVGLAPFGTAGIEEDFNLDDDWRVTASLSAESVTPWGVAVRPDGVQVASLDGTGAPAKLGLNLLIEKGSAPGKRARLLGSEDGSGIELASLGLGFAYEYDGAHDFRVELPLRLALILNLGSADSFINNVIPDGGFEAEFDLTVGYSTIDGLYFKGSGSLEVNIPAHIALGPVEINGLSIEIKPSLSKSRVMLKAGATVNVKLGPLSAVIEDIGFKTFFDFASDNSGNLGPLDLGFAFKPPKGIGLSINAGLVKGGGYLFIDADKGEYAGALELVLNEVIALKAIGLITTRMPDGSDGFSLIVIITADFGTSGIQLGYGFTLLSVGGLLGLNRTMLLAPLMEGVRTGALSRIMFPSNIIENAPRIISDLQTIFPAEEGKFLVGPMLKIGWGTPVPIISISMGIIIEIPGNIAIIGVLKMALPEPSLQPEGATPVLVLQVNFAGVIEFDKSRAFFFAAIFESRILTMTIEGEMGVLVSWGADANFVLSVGGFHPAFDPPPLPFPNPVRVAINILNESNARIRVEAYFALTPNTVQFGAHAELYFKFSKFKVDGHIGFDALMRFSPLYFIISASASMSVKAFGVGIFSIRVRFSLEGPTPWRAKGTGSISLLLFKLSADFDITWGDRKDTTLPPVAVMPILKREFEKVENWSASVPGSNKLLVTLRKFEADPSDLLLHPVGTLSVSQSAVPLDITIDKVGNQRPEDAKKFSLEILSPGFDKADKLEKFPMAQYKDYSDTQKLSLKAFEQQNGGMALSARGRHTDTSRVVRRAVRYETIIIDSNFKRFVKKFYLLTASVFTLFLRGNAVSRSPISNKQKRQMEPFAEKIRITAEGFSVVSNVDNRPISVEAAYFESQASALEYMEQQVRTDASLVGTLHVIPQSEVNIAA